MGYAKRYYADAAEPINTNCFPMRNLSDEEVDSSIDEISKRNLSATVRLRGGHFKLYSTIKPRG